MTDGNRPDEKIVSANPTEDSKTTEVTDPKNEDDNDSGSDGFEVLDDNMTLENASQCTMTTVNQDQYVHDDTGDAFQDVSDGTTPPLSEPPIFNASESKSSNSVPQAPASVASSIGANAVLVNAQDVDSLADVREAINQRRQPAQAARPPLTVAELQDRIENLCAQLAEKTALEDELEREKEDAKAYRRQLDETMAKLFETEEQLEEYRTLNNAGYSDIGDTPPGLQQLLATKDAEIDRLGRQLREKANEEAETKHRMQLLVKELETATGLLAQVNEQRRDDQALMDGMKSTYERRMRYLVLNYAKPGTDAADNVLECPLCNSHHSVKDFSKFEAHMKKCYEDRLHNRGSCACHRDTPSPAEWMQ